jgi:hypothetical protein
MHKFFESRFRLVGRAIGLAAVLGLATSVIGPSSVSPVVGGGADSCSLLMALPSLPGSNPGERFRCSSLED